MHSRSIVFFLLVALFTAAAGCRKSSTPAPAAPATAPTSGDPQLNHQVGGTTPPPQTKHFKGSIGSTLDLQMKLVRNGDQLTGSYFYQKVGTRITLRGTVDKDGNLMLDEFDPNGKQTGVFKGLWKVEAQDNLITLAGNWSKPAGEKGDDKKIAFSLHEEPINFTGEVDIVAKTVKENNKKLMYEVDAQYPQLTGGNNPNFEKFNQLARMFVMKNVAGFKKDMAPDEAEEPRPEGSMGSDLGIGYTINLAQDDLVSVQFDIGSYYQGAAHPNSHTETLNYDLKNGKQLKLADLFKPGSKYLQTFSTYSIADLRKQLKEKNAESLDDMLKEGTAPTAKNFESWTITKRGIGINFDAYQVGPYAAGPQFVMVPYSALKDLIKPDGPIAQFVL
ncbi:MAG TPA: RsiV family protein [Pyrinomonadaceae bacterium]|nr:RsiV family protein [Pyrinomonadaceae bacterium]